MNEPIQRGYAAWQAGKPINPRAGGKWIEGWRAGDDGAHWQRIAETIGARVYGWSYRHSVSFVFPNGETHNVNGQMLHAIERLASRIEAQRGETRSGSISEADESLTRIAGDAHTQAPREFK